MSAAAGVPITDSMLTEVRRIASLVRRETIRLVGIAKSGHYTSVFSCAEILGVLYGAIMRLSDDPDWPQRDRLVLSKGHMAVGIYPILAERGWFPHAWLDDYTRVGSPLGDHPDMRRVPGIDFSSGSLGHGLSIATGMAQAARMRGYEQVTVYALLGDQELNEGQIWEAAQVASHHGLNNLVAIVDRNQMGLDGLTEEVLSVDPIDRRFAAFGWETINVDGHDPRALYAALSTARSDRPRCVVADTVKGKGIEYMELSRTWHLGYLAPTDAAAALNELEQA